ncbi:HTH-type transcriptional regulator LeuO [mine drainage metagenome]|jgi:DNA-binding transcriptional LysR family regulator|uniref:HTH-type transcriptional regulator LeuO n=1 Tax=mine drainage metagenome TaxID=410659 RepID=A0A1J5R5U3_9ZZZZ
MHLSRVDLNLFVVFDAIDRERSVTRAAHALNLTQPALSHALRRLRALFDDALFTRQGHAMVPTPLARSLIDPVRDALRTLDSSVRNAQTFDPRRSERTFTIALRDVLEAAVLPSLVGRLRELAPAVSLATVRIDRAELASELAAGTVDLALDVALQLPPSVHRARLLRDAQVVVVRERHPAVGATLDLDTYLALDHVLVSARRRGPGLPDVALAQADLSRRIALRCQHYDAACRVVAATDLLLTMPGLYARMANQGLANRVLPLPLELAPLDVYLYWHDNAALDAANRWLRGQLQHSVAAAA